MANTKYEITDIAHRQYPFLHRIKALRNIGDKVKAGDLGGYVESEQNLSFEPGDEAWLFDEAICCNEAMVDKNSVLKDRAMVSGAAYITGGAALSGAAQAADTAYVCGAALSFGCKALENCVIAPSRKTGRAPMLGGDITIYGTIIGDVRVSGKMALMENERILNNSIDTLVISSGRRSVIPAAARGNLRPLTERRDNTRAERKIIEMAR